MIETTPTRITIGDVHCGAPLSTPGHRMVTRDPRIDEGEDLADV